LQFCVQRILKVAALPKAEGGFKKIHLPGRSRWFPCSKKTLWNLKKQFYHSEYNPFSFCGRFDSWVGTYFRGVTRLWDFSKEDETLLLILKNSN